MLPLHLFAYFARALISLLFSSFLCQGSAAAFDSGSPWTLLLTFLDTLILPVEKNKSVLNKIKEINDLLGYVDLLLS